MHDIDLYESDFINYFQLQIGSDYFQNILNCEKNELLKSLTEFRQTVMKDK